MQEVYSALLLHSAGQTITEENIRKILQSISANIDENKIKALVASLEGVNIDDAIKQAAVAAPVVEEKKEGKKPEDEKKAEETASAGLSALFG